MKQNQLEKNICQSIFDYDDELGVLKWKENRSSNARKGDIAGNKKSDKDGYYQIKIDGKSYRRHVLIWNWHNGLIPEGFFIDHIENVDIELNDCDLISNLQLLTHSNNITKAKRKSVNEYGFIGITKRRNSNKWLAGIKHKGKYYYLGSFDTPNDAAIAYNEAALKYHGVYAKLNSV